MQIFILEHRGRICQERTDPKLVITNFTDQTRDLINQTVIRQQQVKQNIKVGYKRLFTQGPHNYTLCILWINEDGANYKKRKKHVPC